MVQLINCNTTKIHILNQTPITYIIIIATLVDTIYLFSVCFHDIFISSDNRTSLILTKCQYFHNENMQNQQIMIYVTFISFLLNAM